MSRLTILRADGSTYWVEHFDDRAFADAWLAEEQTRPYWDPAWSVSIVDEAPSLIAMPAMDQLRAERDRRLAACDWTQLPDSPLGADSKAAWASYRQQLRALPDQPGMDPANPPWPMAPGGTSA